MSIYSSQVLKSPIYNLPIYHFSKIIQGKQYYMRRYMNQFYFIKSDLYLFEIIKILVKLYSIVYCFIGRNFQMCIVNHWYKTNIYELSTFA